MLRYDKMYYINFNAITDALEVVEALPLSPEREQLGEILRRAQQSSEEIYLLEDKPVESFPKCPETFPLHPA